jgi:two-component system response regulator FixJ
MSHKGNVFVVDDDPAMRDSLDFLLGSAGFTVTLFDTAADFLDAHAGLRFGCLISDVRMPDINGMDLLRRLKANASPLPVIIMTGHGDIPLAVEAMKLGAFDFVEKPFEDERLIGMIEAALQQSPNRTKSDAISAEIASRIASLSQRERQVMDGLVAGLSNKLIAREHNISSRTIEVYRANVMTKMQAHNLSELIRLALQAGILND